MGFILFLLFFLLLLFLARLNHQKPPRGVRMRCTVITQHNGALSVFNHANIKPDGATLNRRFYRGEEEEGTNKQKQSRHLK